MEDIRVIKMKDKLAYEVLDATRNCQRGYVGVEFVDAHYAIFSDIQENPLKFACNYNLRGMAHTEEEADTRARGLAERWAAHERLNPPEPEDMRLIPEC
jgi:hypothetical protein